MSYLSPAGPPLSRSFPGNGLDTLAAERRQRNSLKLGVAA